MKHISLFLLVLLIVSLLVTIFPSYFIPKVKAAYLYDYQFSVDESSEWTLDSGAWNWDTANSRLDLTGTGASSVEIFCRITSSSASYTVYETKLNDTATIYPGMIFGYQNSSNFYMARIDVAGDELQLYKKVADAFTKIGSYSTTLNPNDYYIVKVDWVSATEIDVYLDGTERISNINPATGWTSGEVGFRAYGTNTEHGFFDYITVVAQDETPPLYQNIGQNASSIQPNGSIKLYAQGYDETGLDWAWLWTNETGGTGKNYTDKREIYPYTTKNQIFNDSVYEVNSANIFKIDSVYYMIYSRTHEDNNWWDNQTIHIATASSLTGPYTEQKEILGLGTGWESGAVLNPQVVPPWAHNYTNNYWYMWYAGGQNTSTSFQIGSAYCTSTLPNGTWVKSTNNPVIPKGESGWDSTYTCNPGPLWDDNNSEFKVLYRGRLTPTYNDIGLANSSDPLANHTKYANNPVINDIEPQDPYMWWENSTLISLLIFQSPDICGWHSTNFINWTQGWYPDEPFYCLNASDYEADYCDRVMRPSIYCEENQTRPDIITVTFFDEDVEDSYAKTMGLADIMRYEEHYGSPMDMNDVADTWAWSNFTWCNTSIASGTTIQWRIYYNDTSGNVNMTSIQSFSVTSVENFFGTISQQFTVNHESAWSFNRYSSITEVFALASQKTASFGLDSLITQVFGGDGLGGEPSTVGTSTVEYATRLPFQKLSFYANGRYWLFYANGTDQVYRTSTDASSWSSEAIVVADEDVGAWFSTYFDGTYVHLAWATFSWWDDLYYRRGTPESNGSITWSAAVQEAESGANYQGYADVSITVDTNQYVWISYYNETSIPSGHIYPWITKGNVTNGVWTTESGYPMRLAERFRYIPTITKMNNGKIYCVYGMGDDRTTEGKLYGRLYNGTAWETEENVSTSLMDATYFDRFTIHAIGDIVHVVFLKNETFDIIHVKYSGSWGSENTVQSSVSGASPVIGDLNNLLYCFWANNDHIYYKSYDTGWSSSTDWIDESTDHLNRTDGLTCSLNSYNGELYIAYVTKGAPVDVKFACLSSGDGEFGAVLSWSFLRYVAVSPILSVNTIRSWVFNRFASINTVATISSFAEFISATILNLFSSIGLLFAVTSQKTMGFNLYSILNPTFTITSLFESSALLNLFGTINQVLNVAFQKTVAFNLASTINAVFAVVGTYTSGAFLNFFGVINEIANIGVQKAVSFNRYSTINPVFSIQATYSSGTFLNLFGTIIQQFTVTMQKALTFNRYSTLTPFFRIDSIAQFTQPSILNFYGIINQVLSIVGWTDLTPISIYATEDYVLTMVLLAVVVILPFVVGFALISRKRREEE